MVETYRETSDLQGRTLEISAESWLEFAKRIPSETLTPWPRVSNNIFFSLQFAGRDAIERAQRRYFGIEKHGRLVATVATYWLSESTLRVRNFYCLPAERRKGLMRQCLEYALASQEPKPKRVFAFVTDDGLEFHRRCGFQPVLNWENRPLEFFNFETKGYVRSQDQGLTLMKKIITF